MSRNERDQRDDREDEDRPRRDERYDDDRARREDRPGREDRDEEDSIRRRRRPHYERGVVLFADKGGSIIRTGDEALDEDMPVLNAFRQFLDQERRRARRQMIMLIAFFILLVLALAGAGGWYMVDRLRRMGRELETAQLRQEEARLETVSNLQTVARAAVSLKKDVIDTRQSSVDLQRKMAEQTGELDKLLDTITALEIQNSILQRSVKKLDSDRDRLVYRPELEPLPPEPPLPLPEPRRLAPQAVPESAAPPAATSAKPAPEPTPAPLAPGPIPMRIPLPKE